MHDISKPEPVLVIAVYTRMPVQMADGGVPATQQYASSYRWFLPEHRDRAEADVAEGTANGVEKSLHALTASQIKSLSNVKLRLAAASFAGLSLDD